MLNFHTESEYMLLPTPLPLVKIRCRDERGSEDVTVFEDADEMDLLSILSACEQAYEKWQNERAKAGE